MSLYRETPAALTLHDAGYKPTSRLIARQSFLLIVRTRHIVTVPPTWDETVARDSRMSQHIAEFYNYLGQLIVTAAVYRGLASVLRVKP